MRKTLEMVKISALAALLPFFACGVALGAGPVIPTPMDCSANQYLQGVEEFKKKKTDDECKENKPTKCDELADEDVEDGHDRSVCRNIYDKIIRTLEQYEKSLESRCKSSNAALKTCTDLTASSAEQWNCISQHAESVQKMETELQALMEKTQRRLARLESRSIQIRNFYRAQKDKTFEQGPPSPNSPIKKPLGSDEYLDKCLGLNARRKSSDVFFLNPSDPKSEGRIIDEQNRAIAAASGFRPILNKVIDTHKRRATEFKTRATQFADLAKRARSVDPAALKGKDDPNKSDITKSDPKAPGGGAPPGGGGGSPGGGQGGGSSPQAQDQGGFGATAGTPGSLNTTSGSGKDPLKDSASKPGKGGSRSGEGIESPVPIPKANALSGSFLGGASLGPSSSRAISGDRSGGSSGKAASAKSSGGGGGGGLGDSGGDKPCLGKDCQQALSNLKNGQFAPVGSLGGGGGMGFDADSGSLDSLFKTDEAKKDEGGPGSLDGLASLDAGLDAGGLGGEVGAEVQGNGGEIGQSDGRDLFLRVRSYHLRALKRGLLVGVPKKL